MGSFGVKNCVGMDGIYQVDGEIKFGPIEPEYKEALEFLNELYNEELISHDYLSHDVNMYYANLIDNVGMTWGWAGSGMRTPLLAAGYTEEEARNVFRPIAGAKETIKWMDYKNSQEGAWTVAAGAKNVSWELSENGAPRYTDLIENNPDGLERDEALLKNGGIIWIYTTFAGILENAPRWPFTPEDISTYGSEDKYPDSLISQHENNWLDFDYSRQLPPTVIFSVEEKEEIGLILQDLQTFVEEELHRFVMGLEPIDKWDDNVRQMKDALGAERLVEIYQDAFDRVK